MVSPAISAQLSRAFNAFVGLPWATAETDQKKTSARYSIIVMRSLLVCPMPQVVPGRVVTQPSRRHMPNAHLE